MNVTLLVSKTLTGRYRKLLNTDWSERTVVDAISLIRDQLEHSGIKIVFDWEKAKRSSSAKPYPVTAQMSKHLAEYLSKLNLELKPVADVSLDDVSGARMAVARQAQVAAAVLHLRREKSLKFEGETGFLRDAQSALYHGCVFSLLPELKNSGMQTEHDHLLNALYAHAIMDWTDSPAQESALKALLHDYLGDNRQKENFLRAAFNVTPPADHDYLTKAQSLWFAIMDQHDFQRAFEFLLGLYRSALPQHLPEITQMIDTTLRMTPKRVSLSA